MLNEVAQGRDRSGERWFVWVQSQRELCRGVVDQGEDGKQIGVEFGWIWFGCRRGRAGDIVEDVEGDLAEL